MQSKKVCHLNREGRPICGGGIWKNVIQHFPWEAQSKLAHRNASSEKSIIIACGNALGRSIPLFYSHLEDVQETSWLRHILLHWSHINFIWSQVQLQWIGIDKRGYCWTMVYWPFLASYWPKSSSAAHFYWPWFAEQYWIYQNSERRKHNLGWITKPY